jgi:hypothetical protein
MRGDWRWFIMLVRCFRELGEREMVNGVADYGNSVGEIADRARMRIYGLLMEGLLSAICNFTVSIVDLRVGH